MLLTIDPDFKNKRQDVSDYEHLKVWKDKNSKLGIFGTEVAIDLDLCVGDGACIEVCPVNVFEWYYLNDSDKKAIPWRERDCVYCMGCEAVCPKFAIRIDKIKEVNKND